LVEVKEEGSGIGVGKWDADVEEKRNLGKRSLSNQVYSISRIVSGDNDQLPFFSPLLSSSSSSSSQPVSQ
jgi:hypothetical protein